MALLTRLLVLILLAGVFLISGTSCSGDGGSGDGVSPDPDDGGTTNPDTSATSDWDHAPSYIDPGTDAGNPHYNSGGGRIVRISGTTIALVNDGTRERLYRTTDNGENWTLIDDEPGFSSSLVSGPDNMVYHFTRHGGDLRMVRFPYDAATLPAPAAIGSGVDNGSNHGAYAMLNATVNEAGDLFVFWHHDLGGADGYDTIQMIRSMDGGDTWGAPHTVREGADGDSWGYVHSDVTTDGDLVIVYSEWGAETNQFGVSGDNGENWSHMAVTDNGATSNPCILPAGNDDLYIFAQNRTLDGLAFRKSTNSGMTWTPWTSIQANALMGYADPSPALGADGTIYVAFRGLDTPTQYSDDLRAYVAMSADGGATWTFPDNHLSGGRVGTRSTMRYQTWHNYGGPLEWTWLEEDGDDTGIYPTMYDINAGVLIHNLAN
ncbi:MAG: hypothetical protein GF341_09970 [candidate division Zixibacteria bacterium]|nr:hypothetical protein [candidate division Zixibacteria bacterium]